MAAAVFLTVSIGMVLPFVVLFFFSCYGDRRDLHSFPTRRSSDLTRSQCLPPCGAARSRDRRRPRDRDRKSTRLNSSHITISYAVFCLKKKTAIWRWPPACYRKDRSASCCRSPC